MSTTTTHVYEWDEALEAASHSMLCRLADLTDQVTELLAAEIPEAGGPDSGLRRVLEQMARSNVDNALTAMGQHLPLSQLHPTTASLALARRLGERGVPADNTIRVYQVGHRWLLGQILQELDRLMPQGAPVAAVADLVDWHLGYLNLMSAAAGAEHARTQELWTRTAGAATAAQVNYVLKDADDTDVASSVLHYDVSGRHLGLLLWSDNAAVPASRMAMLVRSLLTQPGVRELIVVPQDLGSVLAWISIASAPTRALTALSRVVREHGDTVRVAAGEPSIGLQGFRLTHQQAQAARRVADLPGSLDQRLTRYRDVAAASLLALHPEESKPWVTEVLGPLAEEGEELARLRFTLRAYLDAGENASNAAQRIYVHRNTVKHRVERALGMLPVPFEQNRLSVALALAYFDRAAPRG
ncbi:MAG: PucR family transcriptional regulator [Actinomycetales bacterium]